MIKSLRFFAVATVAAFALAACDESPTAVTGTISGSVTIEGTGASAVTVSLSSGASTATDASGNYSFSNVEAGSYVVTISGFPADASFSSTSTTAVIASAGQVASANFSGSFIRTSGIVGNVSVATVGPLDGVTVSLSGDGTASTMTDAAGQYAFTGLRAGSYTVTISGFAATYTFASATAAVSVGAGATEIASFSGTLVSNASISGALYFDENDKNDNYDGAALEELVAAPNVLITLNGPSIGESQTTQTDSTGSYIFTDLVAGTYGVMIADTDADIPASVTFGGTSNTTNVTLAAGGSATVYFPFDITQQTVSVCQFTGLDAVSPGHNPVEGADIDLYFLEANVGTGSTIPTQTTDATGCTDFVFDRSVDISPQPGQTDNIVYAELVGTPAGYVDNGESSFEIGYDPKTASSLASDTFDVQSTSSFVSFDVITVTGVDSLSGWDWTSFSDTLGGGAAAGTPTGLLGDVLVNLTLVGPGPITPDTFYAGVNNRLNQLTTPVAHEFSVTPMPVDSLAPVSSAMFGYINNGFALQDSTVHIGTHEVKFLQSDVTVQIHHETDDTLGMTGGDDVTLAGVDEVDVTLWLQRAGSPDSLIATQSGTSGVVIFDGTTGGLDLSTDSLYAISAIWDSTGSDRKVLAQTMFTGLEQWNGASVDANQCQLSAAPMCSTFAHKFNNNTLGGFVTAASDGTPSEGIAVRIQADSATIEANPVDTTVYAISTGAWVLANVTEGMYNISVADSVTAAGDTIWAFISPDTIPADQCMADTEGDLNVDASCDFESTRMDTEVMGVVINDRDQDGNTIDPGEALDGVTIRLYNGGAAVDSMLVDSTTTSSNGYYAFNKLPEGMYTVEADASTASLAATVLQSFDGSGAAVTTQTITTAADGSALGFDFMRQVGDTIAGSNGLGGGSLPGLPSWDYDSSTETALGNGFPTHFTFLAGNTTVTGKAVDGNTAGLPPVAGLTVSLQRCVTSGTPASPAAGGVCSSTFPGAPTNFVTGADGVFTFTDLEEGHYQITINPASAGFTGASDLTLLYETKGAGDVETAAADVVLN